MADKIFITTLVVSLSWNGLIPLPLAVIFIGRDLALTIAAFFIRYRTLPEPKTFKRYWDLSLPSVTVTPSLLSKANTALQLCVVSSALICPVLGFPTSSMWMHVLQIITGSTTILSGIGYIFSNKTLKKV
ncbi:Cardiolipin synthase (CMP-forming) [Smittium culicis]|uniref:Cardiolipin synthase (CMP-forming) n=1 Tax=Smittium culicis TaxID=133412 RepID=A0A1R1Y7L1_9FUNG|nr:Cardiolipin synthase (CMP-forming) [Smittium culicis]